MRFSKSILSIALAPLAVSAVPLRRGTDANTLLVLQFANVLEQFESNFYQQAMMKFQGSDYSSAGFSSAQVAIEEITSIQIDESTHVTAIQEIITSFAETPLTTCVFDFTSVLTDVSTMLSVARLVENVGVGAYLGAAHIIQDPRVLTSAASIATIEARHQSVLNLFAGADPLPQAFDIPLLPQEVLAIAGAFISGCDLGVKANAALSVTTTGSISVGTSLQFSSPALNGSTSGFNCQMMTGGLPFSINLPIDQCVVPSGISGVTAIWITSDNQPLNGNAVDRQSNAIVAGPLLTFIDVQASSMGKLVRTSGGSMPPPSMPAASSVAASSAPPSAPSGAVIANGVSMVAAPTSSSAP